MTSGAATGERRILARVPTAAGELVLRQAGPDFEIISDGVFLMDTRDGRSERLLARAALDRCPAPAPAILIGGLGAGFTLAEAASETRAARIDVVEISPDIIGWHDRYLRHLTGAALADRRVTVIRAGLADWLAGGQGPDAPGPYDIICLDVDNGPDWTVSDANRLLYRGEGLRRLAASLSGDGVLSVWSAAAAPAFQRRLRRWFGQVRAHRVPVARGEPDVVYVAARPRAARLREQGPEPDLIG